MDKRIFISHRSSDEDFADVLCDFLVRCGINKETIFCSSLPGLDVRYQISNEIKSSLKSSLLNFVILSEAYYDSPYCQNEAGIIWFCDVEKIIICLPEINVDLLEGFLDKNNIIRRLNIENDICVISDLVKGIFSEFTNNTAILSDNIRKLISEYEDKLKHRTIPKIEYNINNELEQRILHGEFSDDEIITFKYLNESQKISLGNDDIMFDLWKIELHINKEPSVNVWELLFDEGLAKYNFDDYDRVIGYKLEISVYRNLMKLSKKALDYMAKIAEKYIDNKILDSGHNMIDDLIKNGFGENEILFIKYIKDLSRSIFLYGYKAEDELIKIREWQNINSLNDIVYKHYSSIINRFEIRKLIEVAETTSSNNPKAYKLKENIFTYIENLNNESIANIEKLVEKYKEILPF